MKLAAMAMLALALQGRTLYEDPTRSVRVYGYTTAEGGVLENGDFEFKMTGDPATVESRLEGLKASGQTMQGMVAPTAGDQRSFLRSLQISAGAKLTLDSDMQYQAQLESANRFGTPQPPAPTSKTVAVLQSESASYSGSATEGTFTIPNPFTIEANSEGKRGDAPFTQRLAASGSRAAFTLDPSSQGAVPIQTGTISGPVKVDILRTETPVGKSPEVTKMDGIADQVDLDLKTARTITLRGNVRVHGESGLYVGTSEGDVVVIGLDESLKPISIRITGSPVKSTLREVRGVGGQ